MQKFPNLKNPYHFIATLGDIFPHEKEGIKRFYQTCWQVFNCLDSMPLLSIEDTA